MISGISRQSSGHSLTVHYNMIDMSHQESGFLPGNSPTHSFDPKQRRGGQSTTPSK